MANWTTINANWYGNADASVPAIPIVPTGSSGGPLGVYGGSNVVFAESAMAGRDAGDQSGFFVVTLNGTGPAGTVNWIDGTQTLEYPPAGILMARHDPPAFTPSSSTTAPPYPNPLAVYYPVGYVVLGSGHVQQVTVAGVVGTSAPSWSTSGGTVVSGSATFKDLGAIDAAPVYPIALTAITSTSATLTLSGNGTSGQVAVISFRIYGHS